MTDTTDMGLAVSFTDQSHSFVHGYEAGAIAHRMEIGEAVIDCGCEHGFPIHEENLSLMQRLCAFYKYELDHRSTSDGWAHLVLSKSETKRPMFRVIDGGLR